MATFDLLNYKKKELISNKVRFSNDHPRAIPSVFSRMWEKRNLARVRLIFEITTIVKKSGFCYPKIRIRSYITVVTLKRGGSGHGEENTGD